MELQKKGSRKSLIRNYRKEFPFYMLQIPNTGKKDQLFNFMDGLKPWATIELQGCGVKHILTSLNHGEV